jgi:hypothetical protein
MPTAMGIKRSRSLVPWHGASWSSTDVGARDRHNVAGMTPFQGPTGGSGARGPGPASCLLPHPATERFIGGFFKTAKW